jgi:hypothetical protein
MSRDVPDSASFLAQPDWHMRPGERAAIVGLLAALKPRTSIELGTFKGGSLRAIAAHSTHVHSFDLTLQVERQDFPSVTFHVGDSHELLPRLLGELEQSGERVDFSLVDGDHSPEGVRQDVLDLLASPAVAGLIVLHDTGNDAVRRGLLEVPFERHSKVASVDLDFVLAPPPDGKLTPVWGGLGLIVLDPERAGPGARPVARGDGEAKLWAVARELRRLARRQAGIALRRAGLHPSQRGR